MRDRITKRSEEIEKRTGVDFSRYRTAEMAESLADAALAAHPLWLVPVFLKWILLVFVVANGVAVGAVLASDPGGVTIFLLFAAANAAVPFVGVPFAVIRVLDRILGGLVDALYLSLDVARNVVHDLAARGGLFRVGVADVVQGVVIVVVIPSLNRALRRRFRWLALPVTFVVERVLYSFAVTFSAVVSRMPVVGGGRKPPELVGTTGEQREKESRMVVMIDASRDRVDSILRESVLPGVLFPVRLAYYFATFMALMVLSAILFA
ncbi:MAG: hypothetical protein ACLFOY_07140 [Desulfatibacillaceae bacterium]